MNILLQRSAGPEIEAGGKACAQKAVKMTSEGGRKGSKKGAVGPRLLGFARISPHLLAFWRGIFFIARCGSRVQRRASASDGFPRPPRVSGPKRALRFAQRGPRPSPSRVRDGEGDRSGGPAAL